MAESVETKELTGENYERAYAFARLLLVQAGPMIDAMKLTCNEVELAYAVLLAESLSHRTDGIREFLTEQWQEYIGNAAEELIAERHRRLKG
jgi:hypothetical protein